MTDYTINKTDANEPIKILSPKEIDKETDVTLFGRTRLRYGADMNENLLHLLEKFSCPEDSENVGNPDLAISVDDKLSNPQQGQLWLNSTQERPFFWDGTKWTPLSLASDYAANFGTIISGGQIPKPVSESGYVFDYDECVWIVSPSNLPNRVNYVLCTTNSNAVVTMRYRVSGTSTFVSGCANYMIVGIKDNINNGQLPPDITPTPTPSVTPTPAGLSASFTGGPCIDSIGFTDPCSVVLSGQVMCSRSVVVSGGSGSYSYSWSNETYLSSDFAVDFNSVGNSYSVSDTVVRSCPYSGIASGAATVTITDDITLQSINVIDYWYLEYFTNGEEPIDPTPPDEF
jgi:hypothetical protein